MPILLTEQESAFMERVRHYCERDLTQPQMARAEGISLTAFRNKLMRFGFELEAQVTRNIVRVRSGETYDAMKQAGQIQVCEPEAAGVA